ncbi:MAG: TlpA disulfide reductase family protein [Opitutaceae bacterium]
MKSVRFVPALVLLTFGVAACAPKKDEAPKPKVAAVVDAATLVAMGLAPSWSLKDVNGNLVKSEQFKGKVVVVDFWATWCGPCRIEIPGYIELEKKYGKDGFAVIGISLDQAGPEVVKDFVVKNGINYQVVMGDEAVTAAFGGMEAIPTTFLIDRAGQIRHRKVGIEETAEYEQKVIALLKG